MENLTQEQKLELKTKIVTTAKESPSVVDGWCKATTLGTFIQKNCCIDYKALGFENLTSFLKCLFGDELDQRGVPPQHEYRICKGIDCFEEGPSLKVNAEEQNSSNSVEERFSYKETPYQRILKFAFFPKPADYPYNGFYWALKQLAKKALEEPWFYGETDPGNLPILRKYFLMTFDRLQTEDSSHKNDPTWEQKMKVVDNTNNTFRIQQYGKYIYPQKILLFNTGLVDKLYEPIFAVFTSNEHPITPWKFYNFVSGSGNDSAHMFLAKLYGDKFPQHAKYYDSTRELVYDIDKQICSYHWAHIVDRCDRLPIEFLEDNCPNELKASRDSNGDINFELLSKKIKSNNRVYLCIQNRINDAIEHSLKRVEWNFKTAIPIYYPGGKSISLLLPLSLVGDNIDAALVLENDSSVYIAHTILTLDMAYANARLITRPDSDWLIPSTISITTKDNDDD